MIKIFVEISGVLGLWLGISVVSATEFFIFLGQLFMVIFLDREAKDPDLPHGRIDKTPPPLAGGTM